MNATTKGQADVRIDDFGSLALIEPVTDTGREWCDANLFWESWQETNGAIAVECRNAVDIAGMMREAGLEVAAT